MLAYKVLCGIAPRYLGPLNRVADVSGRRPLRSSRCTTLQTFYGRQSSFSGCCRQDLECTAGQSRLNDVTTDFPAPFEDIVCSSDLFVSTAVDLAVVYMYIT